MTPRRVACPACRHDVELGEVPGAGGWVLCPSCDGWIQLETVAPDAAGPFREGAPVRALVCVRERQVHAHQSDSRHRRWVIPTLMAFGFGAASFWSGELLLSVVAGVAAGGAAVLSMPPLREELWLVGRMLEVRMRPVVFQPPRVSILGASVRAFPSPEGDGWCVGVRPADARDESVVLGAAIGVDEATARAVATLLAEASGARVEPRG